MASEPEEQTETAGAGPDRGLSGRLGQPLFMVASFAAGAVAALGAKALLDSRRSGSSTDAESAEDLPTVLRRAGLDVAIAATNQAAERLGQGQSEAQDGEAVLQGS